MTPPLSPPPRRRLPLRAAALLLVLVALAAGVALAVQPATPHVPLEPGIPNEQALIDAGLAAIPGPGQPTRPVAVDRVLLDGAATYVQYHMPAPSPSGLLGFPFLTLTDDRGAPVTDDFPSAGSATEDAAFPLPLPAWLPWHPAPLQHGYLLLAPLPPTARAAVLRFGPPGSPSGEVVRVPLGPRTRLLSRLAYPRATAHAAGLTLAIQELGVAHLVYAYTLRSGARSPASLSSSFSAFSATTPGGAAPNPDGQLTDRAGHPLPTVTLSTTGAYTADAHGLRCATTLAFPPQPPGTRLTLTVRTLPGGTPFPPATPRPRHSLWRLSLTIP